MELWSELAFAFEGEGRGGTVQMRRMDQQKASTEANNRMFIFGFILDRRGEGVP